MYLTLCGKADESTYLILLAKFNDTYRSVINTLGVLATYLGALYANRVRIHGNLMLHPTSLPKLGPKRSS